MKNIDRSELKDKLIEELNRLYKKYQYRVSHPDEYANNFSVKLAIGIISGSATAGATIGTAVPGPGNAVGAGIGLIAGGAIVGAVYAYNKRNEIKLNHAKNLLGGLENLISKEDDQVELSIKIQALFSNIAEDIIQSRDFHEAELNNINPDSIAKHLSRHAMAALKHYTKTLPDALIDFETLQAKVSEGVKECRSNKANREKFYWSKNQFFSLNKIAKAENGNVEILTNLETNSVPPPGK